MIDDEAKALYVACTLVAPPWEQLGDVTKSVWRERVSPFDFGNYPDETERANDIPSQLPATAQHGESMSTDKINIVQIEAAAGLPITADFITNRLGVAPDPALTVKRAVFWRLDQWPVIVEALKKHLQHLGTVNPASFSGQRPKKAPEAPAAGGDSSFSFGDAAPSPAPAADAGFSFGETSTDASGFDFGGETGAEEGGFFQ